MNKFTIETNALFRSIAVGTLTALLGCSEPGVGDADTDTFRFDAAGAAAAFNADSGVASRAPREVGGLAEELTQLDQIYDPGTQCTVGGNSGFLTQPIITMHCCPSGYVMVGAHVDRNTFRCARVAERPGVRTQSPVRFEEISAAVRDNQDLRDEVNALIRAQVRQGIPACPFGTFMVGLRADQAKFACQSFSGSPVTTEYVDGPPATQDGFPMHVCKPGFAMSGIDLAANRFLCAK